MAQKSKPGGKKPNRSDTPIDAIAKKLADEQAKLNAQMQAYEKLIKEAPERKKEQERVRREQYVKRAARTESRTNSRAALPDWRRYELNAAVPAQHKRLRAERNRGRMMFFFLLLIFLGVVAWVYLTFKQ